jgi:putative hemolysin
MRRARLALLAPLAAVVLLAACGSDDGGSASSATDAGSAGSSTAAGEYCTSSGGEVQTAHPYWNTNADQSDWLALAGSVELCRFTSDDSDPQAQTRIYVDLNTLYSEQPTLAGVAYLSKVPATPPAQPGANPASSNCTALGASSQFGAGAGGWTTEDDPQTVVSLCVFPDLSFIDEFGIFYYSDGTVRGADLAEIMRYQPTQLPPIFTG